MQKLVTPWVALLGLCLACVSCSSGPGLDEAQHEIAEDVVTARAAAAGIELAESDASCVVDGATREQGEELLGVDSSEDSQEFSSHLGDSVADSILDCVGADELARSALFGLVGSISESSLTCAGKAFDEEKLRDYVSSRLAGDDRIDAAVEIDLALVLGVCLSPEELLSQTRT